MLKKLLNKLKGLLSPAKKQPSKPSVAFGDMVGNVKITKQYQLDKHTAFKPGESYRVGEMIVTVHANKESMLKAIAVVDARRAAKEKRLTEKAVNIMLMTPEELAKFQLDTWLAQRQAKHGIISGIVGLITGRKRYIAPETPQPAGSVEERFKELTKDVKSNEKVK